MFKNHGLLETATVHQASIAQWLEHCSRKAGVVSSILTGGCPLGASFLKRPAVPLSKSQFYGLTTSLLQLMTRFIIASNTLIKPVMYINACNELCTNEHSIFFTTIGIGVQTNIRHADRIFM